MSKSNNVILFPKQLESNPNLAKIEDIQHNLEMMRHYHIQETILQLTPMIFNQLDIAGFGLSEDSDDDVKDGALIVEALRSYMSKYYGSFHPFQVIAENVFIEKEDDEGAYKIAEKLELDLKNPEEE